jgi:hypothetical protein
MSAMVFRRFFGLLNVLLLVGVTCPAWSIAVNLDMSSVFNRDGIVSLADPSDDGFDNGGDSLIEDGVGGLPGLPSDGKIQELQLGDFDDVNMLSIVPGDGDISLDLAGTGQARAFQKLSFLGSVGNGSSGTDTDNLMVRLVFEDASTQDILVQSQDWYLGDPPRTPPAPLTLGISGMSRESAGLPPISRFSFTSSITLRPRVLPR